MAIRPLIYQIAVVLVMLPTHLKRWEREELLFTGKKYHSLVSHQDKWSRSGLLTLNKTKCSGRPYSDSRKQKYRAKQFYETEKKLGYVR